MAGPAQQQAFGSFGDIFRSGDLRKRLLFLAGALIVFRIGIHIPVPGIDPTAYAHLFNQHSGGILGIFNVFSGGALRQMSIFALGVMPYISASIIIQMLTSVVPSLEAIKKEGQAGQRKITRYTRYSTVGLALFQSIGAAFALQSQHVALNAGPGFIVTATVSLVTGTMFLMWLGEQVTERGLGNGISMIIFAGIVAGLPSAVAGTLDMVRNGELSSILAILIFVAVLAVTAFVVFVESGQRRITVNYAKRQQGRRMYAAQTSHLPLKLNMSGVIPPIFASSIILFPVTLAGWLGQSSGFGWLQSLTLWLAPGQPLYVVLFAVLIIFFTFFYTALTFNSDETADNLKKSGAFIPGIRPGKQTAGYIDTVLTKLTLWGAIYLVLVCLLPEFLISYTHVQFNFGGTSLLIVVVVAMDFMGQLQAHMMTHQYEGLLKRARMRGLQR
ncbi:MAG: preprotein translocase subunit SecY [Gammaproteobacteria bacterium]